MSTATQALKPHTHRVTVHSRVLLGKRCRRRDVRLSRPPVVGLACWGLRLLGGCWRLLVACVRCRLAGAVFTPAVLSTACCGISPPTHSVCAFALCALCICNDPRPPDFPAASAHCARRSLVSTFLGAFYARYHPVPQSRPASPRTRPAIFLLCPSLLTPQPEHQPPSTTPSLSMSCQLP